MDAEPLAPLWMLGAADVRSLRWCGWAVFRTRTHAWRCNERLGHDGPHALHVGGKLAATASGYRERPTA